MATERRGRDPLSKHAQVYVTVVVVGALQADNEVLMCLLAADAFYKAAGLQLRVFKRRYVHRP